MIGENFPSIEFEWFAVRWSGCNRAAGLDNQQRKQKPRKEGKQEKYEYTNKRQQQGKHKEREKSVEARNT